MNDREDLLEVKLRNSLLVKKNIDKSILECVYNMLKWDPK